MIRSIGDKAAALAGRIALVWNADVPLMDITTRYEPYVDGLRLLGWDALTICRTGLDAGYPYPTRVFSETRQLLDTAFWKSLDCQAALIITWHRMTDVVQAMRAAGLKVLSITDSDGQVSLKHHPWPTLRFRTYLQPTVRGKLAAAKYWLQLRLRSEDEHRDLIENVATSDILALPSQGGVDEFVLLLQRLNASALADRVAWLPYPVFEDFCIHPVATDRSDRIVAVGRWDSPQKNAGLLAAAIDRIASRRPQTEFVIIGRTPEKFASLASKYSRVRALGLQPQHVVREYMSQARVLLMSSRWEGSPIAANEMLALGGTIVGSPSPSICGIAAAGRFGTVAQRHTANALAAAAMGELYRWDAGLCDPQAISAYWRNLVSPAAVAERILTLLNLPAPHTSDIMESAANCV